MPKTLEHAIDAAVGAERVSRSAVERLEDVDLDRLESLTGALEQWTEAAHLALDTFEEWDGAEGRDEKADTKEAHLEALDTLNGAFTDLSEYVSFEKLNQLLDDGGTLDQVPCPTCAGTGLDPDFAAEGVVQHG